MRLLKLGSLIVLKALYEERKEVGAEDSKNIQEMLNLMRSNTIQNKVRGKIGHSRIRELSAKYKLYVDQWLTETYKDGYDINELAMAAVFLAVFDHGNMQEEMYEDMHENMRKDIKEIDSLAMICLMSAAYSDYQLNELMTEVRYRNMIG